MKLGIRVKFIGILLLATVLPLVIAATAVYILGNNYYRNSSGRIFQIRAQQMANYLALSVNGYTDSLQSWIALSDFYHRLEKHNEVLEKIPAKEREAIIAQRAAEWPEEGADSPLLRSVLEDPISNDLMNYMEMSPLFGEIFVTDRFGQTVASTGRTWNFWQAKENWWKEGIQLSFRKSYVGGIRYDSSAEVYSFDVAVPIRDRYNPNAPAAGVVKGVIDASPLFFELTKNFTTDDAEWKVVMEDGTVVFAEGFLPMERRIHPRIVEVFQGKKTGWMIRRMDDGNDQMVGFAVLSWVSKLNPEDPERNLYVLVHLPVSEVLAPVRNQLLMISGFGFLLILVFSLIGYYLAQHELIAPVNLLQRAAQRIAFSALSKTHSDTRIEDIELDPTVRTLLNKISHIKPTDEIGELARDFRSMANRVLSYHTHLESEINAKVTEIQDDLVIAREFQEALMPHDYPELPDQGGQTLSLQFNHIYKPASTVGGDFFNILKLSDDRVGIFIADVMGHGSRSALVTAIVATLLHDLAPKSADPADFMASLNRHFHHLIQHSKQVIFVTAFYLIIDIREKRAVFASAGHPPPILVQRSKNRIKPLLHSMQNDTALGLLEDSTYTCFSTPVAPGDLFLLFTDGLFEVLNPKGEEFGVSKMMEVIKNNIRYDADELGQHILETINRYSGFAAQADDICLVSVEIGPPGDSVRKEPSDSSG